MIDAFREIPVVVIPGVHLAEDEYPRDGCPDCKAPVEPVTVMCNLDEEHERWECQNTACGRDEICEDDLITVQGPDEYPTVDVLDPALLMKRGAVMSSLGEWVKARVRL